MARDVAFERTVRISKRDLDPYFGQEEQALDIAARRAEIPRDPDVVDVELEARDKGSHVEVRLRGIRGPGPRASGRGRGPPGGPPGRGGRGPPRDLDLPFGGFELDAGGLLDFGGPRPPDVVDELERLPKAELMREARAAGIRARGSRRDIARAIAREAPGLARDLAGWWP